MAFDPNRWTIKTQEAFNSALEAARHANHPEVTPDHLVVALASSPDGVVVPERRSAGLTASAQDAKKAEPAKEEAKSNPLGKGLPAGPGAAAARALPRC